MEPLLRLPPELKCPKCGREVWFIKTGLTCPRGCGKIRPMKQTTCSRLAKKRDQMNGH